MESKFCRDRYGVLLADDQRLPRRLVRFPYISGIMLNWLVHR